MPEGRVCRDFITGSYEGFQEVPEGHHSFLRRCQEGLLSFGQGVPDFHSEAVAVFKSGRSYIFPYCTLIYKSKEALKKEKMKKKMKKREKMKAIMLSAYIMAKK